MGKQPLRFDCRLFDYTLFQPDAALKTEGAGGPKGRLKEGEGQETRGAGQSRLNSSVLARLGVGGWGGLAGRWNRRLNVWRRIS